MKKDGFLQPHFLAEQDIVIITYDVLRSELNYVDIPHSNSEDGRRLRNQKRYMAIPSPLVAVDFLFHSQGEGAGSGPGRDQPQARLCLLPLSCRKASHAGQEQILSVDWISSRGRGREPNAEHPFPTAGGYSVFEEPL